jgi:hypothetical protein
MEEKYSQLSDINLTLTQYISNILYFSVERITRKLELFNVVLVLWLMKSLEKEEINILIKVNI